MKDGSSGAPSTSANRRAGGWRSGEMLSHVLCLFMCARNKLLPAWNQDIVTRQDFRCIHRRRHRAVYDAPLAVWADELHLAPVSGGGEAPSRGNRLTQRQPAPKKISGWVINLSTHGKLPQAWIKRIQTIRLGNSETMLASASDEDHCREQDKRQSVMHGLTLTGAGPPISKF